METNFNSLGSVYNIVNMVWALTHRNLQYDGHIHIYMHFTTMTLAGFIA